MKFKKIYHVLFMAALGLVSCKSNNTHEQRDADTFVVEIQNIEAISTSRQLKVSGNIEGNKTVRLGFLVAGKVNFIAANEGETIKQGELLASLDPESYQIAVEMADAQLSQMKDDYKRIKELHDRNSVTESDFVKISNGLRGAQAQYDLQSKNLKDTKLYSPIKGVMLKRGVEEGEIIDQGMPVFGISDIYKVKVIASVPEMELRYVKLGNKAKVYVPSLDSTFVGSIVEIGTLAEATTRTFDVKIELNNPKLLIRPGMTAEITIPTDEEKSMISLPANAILHDTNNESYVYVADTSKGKAFKRTVSLGEINGDDIQIISGLDLNDIVVVNGQHKLSNGTLIKVK